MDLITEGKKKGLIVISDDEKQVTYLPYSKKRSFTNSEEKVQVEAFLNLITKYNYKPERIKIYVPVKMGVDTKEADIIVYNDDECTQPHILVECKRPDISEQEFLQAIEQAYSYAFALPNDVKYLWVTSGLKDEYFEVNHKRNTRTTKTDIPQFGVKRLANYKYVYEANLLRQEEGTQKFSNLAVVDEKKLKDIFKQAHDALWAGGQLNPSEAFDELDKLIFCKIWDERKDRSPGEPYDFQIITVDEDEISKRDTKSSIQVKEEVKRIENERLYNRIKSLYEEGRRKDPEVFRDSIRLTPERIRTVVGYLEGINLGETDLDAKGHAFETFMDSFFRGNFGQYFTPRAIVKFVTDVLPITNESLVLDTSCGSGGFLLYALNRVRRKADELYPNHKTDTNQKLRHYKYWHDFAERNLFGIEINEQISRAAKMNMIIHDDGHTNVVTADALIPAYEIERTTRNSGFRYNYFNLIITNPPFGSTIKRSEKGYFSLYDFSKKETDWLDFKKQNLVTLRDNQSTEVFFIEQCHKYLSENGYLAIVLPDSILTNSSLHYVREGIEDLFQIIAIVSMPQIAFAVTGAGVKSSVLFLKKYSEAHTEWLRSQKLNIQIELKEQFRYYTQIENWEKEKSKKLKTLEGFDPGVILPKAGITKSVEYKAWKEEVSNYYNELVNNLKENLREQYEEVKQKMLPDYQIFMAIAENIGYDATGKKTNNNELDEIGEQLKAFILDNQN